MLSSNAGYIITICILLSFTGGAILGQTAAEQEQYLQRLMKVLPPDRREPAADQLPGTPPAHISPEDFTWGDWLERTGELPPDFSTMPFLPFLPDPLILDEGGENIPVKTMAQWNMKRSQMMKDAQHWITGSVPPAPENLTVEILKEEKKGQLTEREVLLRFGPEQKALLHVSLLYPQGEGPHPVFICPWKKDRYDWVQAAVRRGYIGCRFTATDPKYGFPDDSEAYEALWWPDYDFSTIMRWGWAASRAIDYLYTIPEVNKEQIALIGLSRNGKMALWAAAYDDRITAVVPVSGGTGGENPFRYTSDRYNNETIEVLTRIRPHWLHPRLRFFVGNESRLPVDQNSLMALVAPRGLMLSSSVFESAGNPWGIEQAYHSAKKAYDFLGAGRNIALDLRHGLHAPSATDMERYLDFFDYVFNRGNITPENKLYFDYSFNKWLQTSGEKIDPISFDIKTTNQLLLDSNSVKIKNKQEWEKKIQCIKDQIKWGMGEEPLSVGPGVQTDYMRDVVGYPRTASNIQSNPLLFGELFTSQDNSSQAGNTGKLPVVIYLHEYAYSMGYAKSGDFINKLVQAGFAVYAFDQIGFGSRLEEGRLFYERFPKWSKMGRMVADVRWAIDELVNYKGIDPNRIYIVGYSLGGNVGLYSAALDKRITGAVSICGFTPMRNYKIWNTPGGIYEFSHLHGLLPRLGFFAGEENRLPYDYSDIMAVIAPRPLLVIAPSWDQYASSEEIKNSISEVEGIYDMYDKKDNLRLTVPDNYNRLSNDMKQQTIEWLKLINNTTK